MNWFHLCTGLPVRQYNRSLYFATHCAIWLWRLPSSVPEDLRDFKSCDGDHCIAGFSDFIGQCHWMWVVTTGGVSCYTDFSRENSFVCHQGLMSSKSIIMSNVFLAAITFHRTSISRKELGRNIINRQKKIAYSLISKFIIRVFWLLFPRNLSHPLPFQSNTLPNKKSILHITFYMSQHI